MTELVLLDTEDYGGGIVARLTVNNPAKLNVVGSAALDLLASHLETLAADDDLRAVVLTGAGERAFIGGADIAEMAKLDPAKARVFIGRIHRVCAAIRELPVPVIAGIRGYALGAGLEIAAACDLRLAAADARFGMPEVRVGIPSVVEAALLPHLIGWGRTRRLLMLGEMIGAAEAERWGLVERVVKTDDLADSVNEWVDAVLGGGPRAMRLQKSLIRAWEDLPLRAAIEAGVDSFENAWKTDEPKLAMQAFLEERRAR